MHIDNKEKDILIYGEGPIQGLDETTLTAEDINPINFIQPNKGFELYLQYNGSNVFLLADATKAYQFKAELQRYFKRFAINNVKSKITGEGVQFFLLILILLILTIF